MKSYFITFEGPEGSGKSTQAELLKETFEDAGYPVALTREPGGDQVSENIRNILLHGSDNSVTDRGELLLYLAARAEHTEKVIRPKLNERCSVICGRYIDSTVAYQGYGNGLELDMIYKMNDFATAGLMPDITFLMDIDVEIGLKRQSNWNRMERKSLEFHKRVRNGFLKEAEYHPERIVVINAEDSIEKVRADIIQYIKNRFGLRLNSL